MRCVRTVAVLVLIGGAFFIDARPAEAGANPGPLAGTHFPGIFQSSNNPSGVGFFDVFIDSVKNRSFQCRLRIMDQQPPEPDIPCQGTLSAAGVFEVIARRGVFQVHGRLEDDGLAFAHYRFGRDDGTLLMLQQRSGAPPDPSAYGRFAGAYVSNISQMEGKLMLDILKSRGAGDAFMNVTQIFEDETGEEMVVPLSFNILVSSAPPDPSCKEDQVCAHGFTLVGLSSMSDPGVFVVRGIIGPERGTGQFIFFPMGIDNGDVLDFGTFDVDRTIVPCG